MQDMIDDVPENYIIENEKRENEKVFPFDKHIRFYAWDTFTTKNVEKLLIELPNKSPYLTFDLQENPIDKEQVKTKYILKTSNTLEIPTEELPYNFNLTLQYNVTNKFKQIDLLKRTNNINLNISVKLKPTSITWVLKEVSYDLLYFSGGTSRVTKNLIKLIDLPKEFNPTYHKYPGFMQLQLFNLKTNKLIVLLAWSTMEGLPKSFFPDNVFPYDYESNDN